MSPIQLWRYRAVVKGFGKPFLIKVVYCVIKIIKLYKIMLRIMEGEPLGGTEFIEFGERGPLPSPLVL